MKKVINRKLFNTETAEKIAYWDNDQHRRDFGFMAETLYRTKKGHYFIHGEGGPSTVYASHAYGGRMSGESIYALTDHAAFEWCETRCINPDIVAIHFDIEEA